MADEKEAMKEISLDNPKDSSSAAPAPDTSTATTATTTTAKPASPAPENAPSNPSGPMSQQEQNQLTLQEAFPTVDAGVVKAVLLASGGDLERAFNALLAYSDPSAATEEQPPPPPPRPRPGQTTDSTSTPYSQLEADEIYARQLQAQYGGGARPQQRSARGGRGAARQTGQHRRMDSSDDDYYFDDDKDHSFLDDDLPVIKENIQKGFEDAQTKLKGWWNELTKSDEDLPQQHARQQQQAARGGNQYARAGSRRGTGFGPGYEPGRKNQHAGYDADHRVLSDDFTHLELKDNTEEAPQRRPKANPNLFASGPGTKSPGRKVSFDERPTTINDDDLYRQPAPPRQASPASASKWEPLKSVEPTPLEGDGDPFSLGDSDDEKDGLIREDAPPAKAAKSVTGPQETGVTGATGATKKE